jgi:hypothetical protein
MLAGYVHPLYALSLAEFGQPLELPNSGGWLLKRSIAGFSDYDAMGCYPMFSCQNWTQLTKDLTAVETQLVSLALVADPFGDYTADDLSSWFDTVLPFKHHHVVDLSKPLSISKHHTYYSRKANGSVSIEIGSVPDDFVEQWTELYSCLVRRHQLKGIKAFSKASFELQLKVPGMVVIRALKDDTLVGAHLWYEQQGVAYSHLAAATDTGYALNYSYAIYSAAIEFFRTRVGFINLGAGAGLEANKEAGLDWFKAGWSNSSRTAYFCGRILNAAHYAALTHRTRQQHAGYFPAYRYGEMA